MGISVAKFGGSSLADAKSFMVVRKIIEDDTSRRFVIVSAPGKRNETDFKITDKLLECYYLAQNGESISDEFTKVSDRFLNIVGELHLNIDINKEIENIEKQIASKQDIHYAASRGEYLCAMVLSAYLGWDMIDATELIYFDSNGKLDQKATDKRIGELLPSHEHAVIPGFYGTNPNGEIVTFPRNGSDISGALVARGCGAQIYENWTDVSGFLMADTHIVDTPRMIHQLTYQELRELSYMGASILHEDAILPVSSVGIVTKIKNTNDPEAEGTTISNTPEIDEGCFISGVAGKLGFAIVHMEKVLMNDEIGYARKLLQILEDFNIPLEHLACGIDSISVLVHEKNIAGLVEQIKKRIYEQCNPDHFSIHPDMALIAVVGRKMKRDNGLGKSRIFKALAKYGINSWLIDQGASSVNVFVGVDKTDYEDAVRALYKEFATS